MPDTGWPNGVFARYRTVSGETVDLARGNTLAIKVNCLGCPYRDIVDRYSKTADDAAIRNVAVQNERVARACAEAHADRCRSVAPPETGALPMAEPLAERLKFAAAQVDVNTGEIISHNITMADIPALTTYLGVVIDQCYQIAVVAQEAVEKAGGAIDLWASFGHAMALIDATKHFACAAEQDLQAIHRYDMPPERPPRRTIP